MSKKIPFLYKNYLQWIITDACNYRCSYCLVRSKKGLPISSIKIANGLKNHLNGEWEIVILGGEPFVQPDFLVSTKKLVALGHRISVFTNFSALPEKIIKFLKITRNKLSGFFASLHLEYTTPEDFLNKINQIEKTFPGFKKRLFVCSVALPKKLKQLEKIKKLFFNENIQVVVTPYQEPNLDFFHYSEKQKIYLKQLNQNYNLPEYNDFAAAYSGHGLEPILTNFYGQKCSAGQKSFFLLPNGDAYRCLAAYRVKEGFLGNIIENKFYLKKNVGKCSYGQCSCPALYNQYFWWQDKIKSNKND